MEELKVYAVTLKDKLKGNEWKHHFSAASLEEARKSIEEECLEMNKVITSEISVDDSIKIDNVMEFDPNLRISDLDLGSEEKQALYETLEGILAT